MQSNLRAAVDVSRTRDGYRARLTTTSPTASGERVLEDARCERLFESVAVVLALTVALPEDTSHSDRATRLQLAGAAHVSAQLGSLPKLALGVGAGLALEVSALRLELRGTLHLPQSATFAGTELGARFRALSFAARGCWLSRFGAVELGPCLGADVQQISATGFGGDGRLSGQRTSWAPVLGGFGRLRLARWLGIVVVLEGAVPSARPRYVYADLGLLHRASRVAAQWLIAPEVQF